MPHAPTHHRLDKAGVHREVAAALAAQLLARRPIFLDTETTGLSKTAQICELALIDTDGTVLLSELVRPSVPIEPSAAAVHHITDDQVAAAPRFGQLWRAVEPLLRGRELFSYNWDFDERLLDQSAYAQGLTLHLRGHCAMQLYATFHGTRRGVGPSYRFYSLEVAAQACGLAIPNTLHRAAADAELCRRLVHHMAAQHATEERTATHAP